MQNGWSGASREVACDVLVALSSRRGTTRLPSAATRWLFLLDPTPGLASFSPFGKCALCENSVLTGAFGFTRAIMAASIENVRGASLHGDVPLSHYAGLVLERHCRHQACSLSKINEF